MKGQLKIRFDRVLLQGRYHLADPCKVRLHAELHQSEFFLGNAFTLTSDVLQPKLPTWLDYDICGRVLDSRDTSATGLVHLLQGVSLLLSEWPECQAHRLYLSSDFGTNSLCVV